MADAGYAKGERAQADHVRGVGFEYAATHLDADRPSGADRIVDSAGARLAAARLPHGRYVEAPVAYHEVLQETDEIRAVFWKEFDAMAAAVAA